MQGLAVRAIPSHRTEFSGCGGHPQDDTARSQHYQRQALTRACYRLPRQPARGRKALTWGAASRGVLPTEASPGACSPAAPEAPRVAAPTAPPALAPLPGSCQPQAGVLAGLFWEGTSLVASFVRGFHRQASSVRGLCSPPAGPGATSWPSPPHRDTYVNICHGTKSGKIMSPSREMVCHEICVCATLVSQGWERSA